MPNIIMDNPYIAAFVQDVPQIGCSKTNISLFLIKCPKDFNNLLALRDLPLSLVIIGMWSHALRRYFRVTAVAKPLYLRAVRATNCPYRILTGLPAEPTVLPAIFTEFSQGYQLHLQNFERVTGYTYRTVTALQATEL